MTLKRSNDSAPARAWRGAAAIALASAFAWMGGVPASGDTLPAEGGDAPASIAAASETPYDQALAEFDPLEVRAGGDTTVFDETVNAYSLSARNMPRERRRKFAVGNSFFNDNWVAAPASTTGRDGLGPLFNARSCSACHFMDGRGAPPNEPGKPVVSLLLRMSAPGRMGNGAPVPDPNYGDQIQNNAIAGAEPEATFDIAWSERPGHYDDGEPYSLRVPEYRFHSIGYGSIHPRARFSARVAPAVFGSGLLEAIPEEDILALADPADANGDGITGRPNMVWDVRKNGYSLGRFGWKSNQPTVEQQVAGAFNGDIGITSSLFPNQNHMPSQSGLDDMPNGGEPELDDAKLEAVTFYSKTLAVPARRNADDPTVLRGKKLFHQAGCASCHTPSFKTGVDEDFPELSNQTIWPYADLLLHDMGPALADARADFGANGREWRTQPLWGLGLMRAVNGHESLLHDGRARGPEEAILWHDGESAASRDAFKAMSKSDRDALVAFLRSL